MNQPLPENSGIERAHPAAATAEGGLFARPSHLLADPRLQFPVIGLALLALIWLGTWMLVDSGYRSAHAAAATNTMKLAGIYEAQVVRALREVDLTLRFMQHAFEDELSRADAPEPLLPGLAGRNLLPPDLLFVVSIADAQGRLVERTRDPGMDSVAGLAWFDDQRYSDAFLISQQQYVPADDNWAVHF
ncbi:MAG: hypothetical protein ACO1PZ_02555, partial [Gammaproteobacteria bacterium]